jgi:hypothetical protein
MKYCLSGLVCGLLVLVIIGCAQQEEEAAFTAETVNAAELYTMFTEDSPYTDWSFWEDAKGIIEGQAPHGALIRTYVNDKVLAASGDTYPYGSIIVKENFMPDTTMAALTVMYKVRGYNPEDGDWFWVKYEADGSVGAEGKVKGCISCHRARKDQDYAFLHDLK